MFNVYSKIILVFFSFHGILHNIVLVILLVDVIVLFYNALMAATSDITHQMKFFVTDTVLVPGFTVTGMIYCCGDSVHFESIR